MMSATFPSAIPAWRLVVLPFSQQRCFIAFTYSHALGDGLSGIAFHTTLLTAFQEHCLTQDLTCTPTLKQLHPPFDTSQNLPISWGFLLSPLLGAYLPTSLASLLGLQAAANSITPGTWVATPTFYDPERYRTGVELLSVDATTLGQALNICRIHGAKLTSVLHQLIIGALSGTLPGPNNVTDFAARTAINMRAPVGRPGDEMGNYSSGHFQVYPFKLSAKPSNHGIDWTLAKSDTAKLAVAANKLQDQPVGLLRYLRDIRSWTISQIGQRRDCSYELSNLTGFRPSGPLQRCSITEMIFCQPADVNGAPLTFNVVSVVGGPLSIAVSWQIGALDLASNRDEKDFVSDVCQRIRRGFDELIVTSGS